MLNKLGDRDNKLKVGFTASTFDLLHSGHILMLQEARSKCDYLIVGLQSDPTIDRASKNKPVQSIIERQIQLAAVTVVDEIIVYNTEADLEELLNSLPINIRILGVEYQDKDFTGREICNRREIEIYFNTRDHKYSSSGLRRRVYEAESNRTAASDRDPS